MKYNYLLDKRKIIVTATIKNNNDIKEIRFILDTGATLTLLDKETASYLGYNMSGLSTEILQTISGKMSAKILTVQSMKFCDKIVRNFPLRVINFPMQVAYMANGLIGMDFLLKLKSLKIDFTEKTIEV